MGTTKYTKGYLAVVLYCNGVRKSKFIHRLVAETFIPNINNYPIINHKDEFNVFDNSVENLEWCDYSYNNSYGTKVKRIKDKQSKKVYQYSKDYKLIKIWDSVNECGRNGYQASKVSLCCNTKRKYHKNSIWSFEPYGKDKK
ncbi:hypothetical protein CBU02nite_32530 [Clostridium butyricum]|jgi:hypothetical protein|uniref:HNH nuclease domain-containing protein n=1 Tax=Clostridium butyricum TaxID=1492 RepID=A0A512TR39_CLOBU|nr:HNH endonuclease [Clostridium butyricum]NOW22132.1 hypothetical protein [Clostridium butyricum]GEQ22747.1 hypothetical protein CBU02nite_32530 [Clostridium butyricum]